MPTGVQSEVTSSSRRPAALPRSGFTARRVVRLAVFFGVAALVVLFVLMDLGKLWNVMKEVHIGWLIVCLVSTVASYALMAWSYEEIAAAAGASVRFREMFKITLVANTMNYLLATGGLSGFAARLYLFTRRGVPSDIAVIISLLQTFITNVSLLFFVLAGFLHLFRIHPLRGAALIVSATLLAVFAFAAVIAALLLFHADLRRRTLFFLAQTAHWFLYRFIPHRTPPRTHIWRYQRNLNRGLDLMLARKRQMIMPTFLIFVDWIVTLLILHTAFLAVNHSIPATFTVVGFAIGILTSLLSVIPGGLGIMEGSMAALYATLDVPLETAVAAILLFRASYYLLPVLISLLFFHHTFEQGRHGIE